MYFTLTGQGDRDENQKGKSQSKRENESDKGKSLMGTHCLLMWKHITANAEKPSANSHLCAFAFRPCPWSAAETHL